MRFWIASSLTLLAMTSSNRGLHARLQYLQSLAEAERFRLVQERLAASGALPGGADSPHILGFLKVPMWKLPSIARHMRKLKGDASANIALFDGVDTMLRTLAGNGVQLAVVSSDSDEALVRDLTFHLPGGSIDRRNRPPLYEMPPSGPVTVEGVGLSASRNRAASKGRGASC